MTVAELVENLFEPGLQEKCATTAQNFRLHWRSQFQAYQLVTEDGYTLDPFADDGNVDPEILIGFAGITQGGAGWLQSRSGCS